MEKTRWLFLDRRLLGRRTVEDVFPYPRREISSLGGTVEFTAGGGRGAAEPRCGFPLLLLLCFWLPADRLRRAERERAAGRTKGRAVVQSPFAPGCRLGSQR